MSTLRAMRLKVLFVSAAVLLGAGPVLAEDTCGDQVHSCACAAHTPCICCDNGGNCVWWAWHEACCNWNRALEWCTDATTWDDYATSNGYPVGTIPQNSSIFVCEASSTCSGWGHVGYVVTAHPDGSYDTTEMACGGWYGVQSRTRPAGFAEHYIYDPGGTPVERDDSAYVSETVPDGTHFAPGSSFTKRWTMRNTGNTTWTAAGGYVWSWDGDEQFSAAAQTALSSGASIAPSGTYDWDVPMTAPAAPGTYRGYWRMERIGTGKFGERAWVEIIVDSAPPVDVTEVPADDIFEPAPEPTPEPAGPDANPEPPADSALDLPPDAALDSPEQALDLPDSGVQDIAPPGDAGDDSLIGVRSLEGGCACSIP